MDDRKRNKKRCLAKGLTVLEERACQQLSPFELKNHLIDQAKVAAKPPRKPYLNAGRGNPNSFTTLARTAFCTLIYFALDLAEPKREQVPHLGFTPDPEDATEDRFLEYFRDDHSEEAVFLRDAIETAVTVFDLKPDGPDGLIWELTDAVRGDFYPDPPRIFPNIEKIVRRYLEQILISDPKRRGQRFEVFATEGATAGMLYVFNSLKENFLLKADDRVAVITPVFSPYLEIPKLNDYRLELVPIDTSEGEEWQLPPDQLKKLKDDKSIKALYLINPTNPGAVALNSETIEALAEIVNNHNPGLIIIVDAVYSTFVESYRSIINKMPANCITVYSFSKYFGVTGWRLGVVMIYDDNIIDQKLLPALHSKEMDALRDRYGIVSEHPDTLTFMQRMVFDSREVALAHTGGLSGPQQVQDGALRHVQPPTPRDVQAGSTGNLDPTDPALVQRVDGPPGARRPARHPLLHSDRHSTASSRLRRPKVVKEKRTGILALPSAALLSGRFRPLPRHRQSQCGATRPWLFRARTGGSE